MKSVLFVCLGNICRSPAAEGVMRQWAMDQKVADKLIIDSAGTGDWHVGSKPDARMRQAAQKRGLSLESRGRQVSLEDFTRFDLIVAMDRDNVRNLQLMGCKGSNLHLLGEFLPESPGPPGPPESPESPLDVPDPYYGGPDGFDHVLDMLDAACPVIGHTLLSL